MTDWYENRNQLQEGMVFATCDEGLVVELARRVPGDGTQWYVRTYSWHLGTWISEEYTIEPGDLTTLFGRL
jgi:hypothetical protein